MSPEVTVITAVYNDERFIRQSVSSILDQTFADFEYIVVDDGSTDSTFTILQELAREDKRLQVIRQRNQGPAAARNLAISQARGRFIALQDSDDVSNPDRLMQQYSQLVTRNPSTISCSNFNVIDEEDSLVTVNAKKYADINANILKGSFCVCHPSIMMATTLIRQAGAYDSFYEKAEDYDMIYRVMEIGGRFEKMESCLYNLRVRANSEGSRNNGAFARRVFENHRCRIVGESEDFSSISNDNVVIRNHYQKRLASEIFYSENYRKFIGVYCRSFHQLPVRAFAPLFVYALLPGFLKKLIRNRILN